MATATLEKPCTETINRAGKYLTFTLGEENFGLEILNIREIMQVLNITPVPNTPHHIKGVVNIRGKVIPIVDLRLKFNMPEVEHTVQTCIIVVYVGAAEIGLIVDRVSEVMDIHEDDIEDTPDFGTDIDTNALLGISKAAGRVTILLDIHRVLRAEDFEKVL